MYNEGSQTPPIEENVVKWLLENQYFVQQYARTSDEGKTALHIAVEAETDYNIYFVSSFCRGFVARRALVTMLENAEFSKACINVPDKFGLCPLVYVLRACTWPPLLDFMCDYLGAARMILKNAHLRLHGMFGIGQAPGSKPATLGVYDRLRRQSRAKLFKGNPDRLSCMNPSPSLRILAGFFSKHIPTYDVTSHILSGNSGNLDDKAKAQAMVTCIDFSSWLFNPAKMEEKKSAAVVRKFYAKHAKTCMEARSKFQSDLVAEADKLLLLPFYKRLAQKFGIASETWKLVLQFADWRNFVEPELAKLHEMNDVLNCDIPSFFLGGIESCLKRKHELPDAAWKRMLEYAGWTTEMSSIDVIPEVPRDLATRKRKRD